MARLTNPGLVELDSGLRMALVIGPTTEDPFSEEELEIGWEHHRERLMEPHPSDQVGSRPWGWWHFEAERDEHPFPYPSASEFEGRLEEHVKALKRYEARADHLAGRKRAPSRRRARRACRAGQ